MNINKGQYLTFASGEYDEYRVNYLTVVLVDFNINENKQLWEAEHTVKHPARSYSRMVSGVDFPSWLVSKGLIEYIQYDEIHTGSYGDSQIEFNGDEL